MTAPENSLHSQNDYTIAPGSVVLVGCGPGAFDLLTLRALRAIESADVLVYDNLVSTEIIASAKPSAERIYVGKKASKHTMPQEEINTLLVDLARRGLRVARLKGGDPFIFGRGGEEMDELHAAGIPCTVIPGITAAAGCAAAAGIPLTHRDHAQTLILATGHQKQPGLTLDWPQLAHGNQTLVFYMGISNAPEIAHQLEQHGLPASTPVALIERGTTPRQRVSCTSLAQLVDHIAQEAIHPPALLIVGSVAGHYAQGE
ncbi:MAG TPA: uroporphyrinogen-III C-methyltransferase [Rhodocyclaceae bacterium]|jgi:uroporphyrin-III C-methyltransferase/precorrin-2 dehydrogenase/sirohydrochlorin ferrochelatase/uroporphyrin-III C-methyltransferase